MHIYRENMSKSH